MKKNMVMKLLYRDITTGLESQMNKNMGKSTVNMNGNWASTGVYRACYCCGYKLA